MKLYLLLLLCLCRLGVTMETEADSCGETFSPEAHRAIGEATEQLGLQLLENLPVSPQQPNIILSPLSIAFALGQLTLGARNETEKLLLKTLHARGLACYHHALGSLVPHFSHTSLEVAARMYLRPGFKVKSSFVEDSLARYQSQPVPLVSVEEVNQWVENVTNGHIPNFLESVPHDVVLMLMNAVYFKGQWQTQFDPQATSKGEFYLDSQNFVSVDMMKSAQYPLRLMYDAKLEAQVTPRTNVISHLYVEINFPFKGNTMLPKLNISDLYRSLPQEKPMQVNLPKVKLQYHQELQAALTNMGLGSLFSGPDLSGISDQPLTVTGVRHASTIELSEEGVEASATTVVTSMRSVSFFSVNSPFLFALVDDASLAPLFMGIVTNPAPDNSMPNDDPHSNSIMSTPGDCHKKRHGSQTEQSSKPGEGNGTIDFPEFLSS
uniref:Serpin domain-containing protein n=1 Tax=Amphilophus citrinellus TaxID=61819 RepID=A0A3Q0R5N7_AMPCI